MASVAVTVVKKSAPEVSELRKLRSTLPRSIYRGPVWAQGRLRNPASRAARKARTEQEARLQKYTESATHGEDIFVYSHVQTNQIIYSLSRTINQYDALTQLTFTGKKSLPTAIRRDHWLPLLHIRFPSRTLGVKAYQLLREFRKCHEFDYPLDSITVSRDHPYYAVRKPYLPEEREKWEKNIARKERGNQLAGRRDRMKMLMDQKANSIADIAKVLELQERDLTPEGQQRTEKKRLEREWRVSNKEAKRRIRRHDVWVEEEEKRIQLLEVALRATERRWTWFQKTAPESEATKEWRRKTLELKSAIAAKRGSIITAKAKLDKQTAANAAKRELQKAAEEAGQTIQRPWKQNPQQIQAGLSEHQRQEASEPFERSVAESPNEPTSEPVKLLWASLPDTSFAPSWPKDTLHGSLPLTKDGFPAGFDEQLAKEGYRVGEELQKWEQMKLRRMGYDVGGEEEGVAMPEKVEGKSTMKLEEAAKSKQPEETRAGFLKQKAGGIFQSLRERISRWNRGD